MAGGAYQKAADLVVATADQAGYGGKRWTDPFIPACDLKLRMEARGEVREYQRSVDFASGVAAVHWNDERGELSAGQIMETGQRAGHGFKRGRATTKPNPF